MMALRGGYNLNHAFLPGKRAGASVVRPHEDSGVSKGSEKVKV